MTPATFLNLHFDVLCCSLFFFRFGKKKRIAIKVGSRIPSSAPVFEDQETLKVKHAHIEWRGVHELAGQWFAGQWTDGIFQKVPLLVNDWIQTTNLDFGMFFFFVGGGWHICDKKLKSKSLRVGFG